MPGPAASRAAAHPSHIRVITIIILMTATGPLLATYAHTLQTFQYDREVCAGSLGTFKTVAEGRGARDSGARIQLGGGLRRAAEVGGEADERGAGLGLGDAAVA